MVNVALLAALTLQHPADSVQIVTRDIANMKARPNWEKVNAPFYQYFVAPFKDKTFAGLQKAA